MGRTISGPNLSVKNQKRHHGKAQQPFEGFVFPLSFRHARECASRIVGPPAIPTVPAATGYDLLKEIHRSKAAMAAREATAHVTITGDRWIVLAIGFVVSFIVAFGVVEWFLMWVRKHGFTLFAIYRILLGAFLLLGGARLIGG